MRVSAEQRRRDLVEAAYQVIARVGLQAATTRAICEQAGVTRSVFHYCFHSKREMLQELVTTTVTYMTDASRSSVVGARGPREALLILLRDLWAAVLSHPERQLAMYELTMHMLRDEDLRDLVRWQYALYIRSMDESMAQIEEVTGAQWVVPRTTVSRLVLSSFDGLVLNWLTDRDDEAANMVLEALATSTAGLAMEPSSAR